MFEDTANAKGVLVGAETIGASGVSLKSASNQVLGPWGVSGGIDLLGLVSTSGTATLSALSFKLYRKF